MRSLTAPRTFERVKPQPPQAWWCVATLRLATRPCRSTAQPDLTKSPGLGKVVVRREIADVVVIGAGQSGMQAADTARAEGHRVALLDARDGNEVVAIYAGPTVIVRRPEAMVHIHAHQVVVATGAAEIHPVCPGSGCRDRHRPRRGGVARCRCRSWSGRHDRALPVRRSGATRQRAHRRDSKATTECGRWSRSTTPEWRQQRRAIPPSSDLGLRPRDLLSRMAHRRKR